MKKKRLKLKTYFQKQELKRHVTKTLIEKSNSLKDEKMKKVKFSSTITIYPEPQNLSDDLQKSRINDYVQRKADYDRIERLLKPIFSVEHRKKVFDKICTL